MRFHHSTRRGRTRFSQSPGHHNLLGASGKGNSLSSRWAHLSYCRQTNIHFNCRLPVALPEEMRLKESAARCCDTGACGPFFAGPADGGGGGDASPFLSGSPHSKLAAKRFECVAVAQQAGTDERNGQQDDEATRREQPLASGRAPGGKQAIQNDTNVQPYDKSAPPQAAPQRQDLKAERDNGGERKLAAAAAAAASEANNSKQQAAATVAPAAGPKPLDIEGARERLIAQVEKRSFWSTKAARRMRLLDLRERLIYIYELTSYCERRDLEWRYEAYRGGKLSASSLAAAGLHRALPQLTTLTVSASVRLEQAPGQRARTACGGPTTPYGAPLEAPSGGTQSNFDSDASRLGKGSPSNSDQQRRLPSPFAFEQPIPDAATTIAATEPPAAKHTSAMSVRRSCSSAAASPVHQQSASMGQFAGTSILTLARPDTPPSSAQGPNAGGGKQQAGSNSPVLAAPASGLPPELVWAIEPPARLKPALFANCLHTSEVPGTSFVKRCHGCEGRGRLKCSSCHGVGYEVCLTCTGKGSLRAHSALGRPATSGASGSSASDYYKRGGTAGATGNSVTGSMWANADADTSARLGGNRHDELSSAAGSSSEPCPNCSGAGQKRCWICAGRAYIICTACAGTGALRCFLNLNITYVNHRDELCLNNSDALLPRDRLKLSSGLLLVDEVGERLSPLAASKHFSGLGCGASGSTAASKQAPQGPRQSENQNGQSEFGAAGLSYTNLAQEGASAAELDGPRARASIPSATTDQQQQHRRAVGSLEQMVRSADELSQLSAMSERLLEKHWTAYKSERLIAQRQRVVQIECFKVDWELRKKRGHFAIYGDEQKVYIAKYPFKSLCSIT